jgi:hypothetical protein
VVGAQFSKTIWRGLPPPGRSRAGAESHYLGVHVPLSRRFLMLDPAQIAYSTLRVRSQLDIAGGWKNHSLSAWRFIVFHVDSSALGAEPTPERKRLRHLLWADNPLVIGESIRCEVDEEVLVDRRTDQSSFAKVLLEFDRRPEVTPVEAEMALRRVVDTLTERGKKAPGLRLLAVSWARRQQLQRLRQNGEYDLTDWMTEGPKIAYLELLFDNAAWAAQFLACGDVVVPVFGPMFAAAGAYLVDEHCEFDRR